MVIGILALQGCVEPHKKHLEALGAEVRLIRMPQDLIGIDGLILPGGESSTMLKLMKSFALWEPVKELSHKIPFWGICAGSILMAKAVENPKQDCLAVMDVAVKRNAYGRQLESFEAPIELNDLELDELASAVFIRAPKFSHWGADVKVCGQVKGEPVFLESGSHMVTAFHPELTESHWCHKIFLDKCRILHREVNIC